MLPLAAALIAAAAPAPATLDFTKTFATTGEPRYLHYRLLYRSADGIHRLAVWRDGDRRLKRLTDDALASYAFHPGSGPGYTLSMLDLKRRIHTMVDRTNLYRVGGFTDWYDLGHGLRHPQGQYRLAAGTAPAGMPAVPGTCTWYDLTQAGRTTHICWDKAHRVPLLIADPANRPVWRITAIDTRAIPAATFRIDDKGFTRIDANRDIGAD